MSRCRSGCFHRRTTSPKRRSGLTLLELTLALSLMVMLVSLTMVTVGRSDERRGFRSAAERIGTLFRMARAESAGRGRRFRIAFAENDEGDKLPAIVVLWEAEPLAEPGQFTEYTVSTWSSYIPTFACSVAHLSGQARTAHSSGAA